MNKQLTKRNIGIAASAALIASLAISGSAFAGKNDNNGQKIGDINGQKGSIMVESVCYLEGTDIRVRTKITDTSSVAGDAQLSGMTVQAQAKIGKERFDIGDVADADPLLDYVNGPFVEDPLDPYYGRAYYQDPEGKGVVIPLCYSGQGNPTLADYDAKSVNAEIVVWISDDHNNKENGFITRCMDDPTTPQDEVAALNVWNANPCK